MNDLYFSIPILNADYDDLSSLQKNVASAIMEHQNLFLPLMERIIDMGDANMTVIEGSLNIEADDVNINLKTLEGLASGMFDSDYYASCKDMQLQDDHEISLAFIAEDAALFFDIKLPPAWRPDDYM